jgi:hypothetical protein
VGQFSNRTPGKMCRLLTALKEARYCPCGSVQDCSWEELDDETTDGDREYGKVNSRTLGSRMKEHTAKLTSNNVLSQATIELLSKARGPGVSTGFLLETPTVACGVHGQPREHSLSLSQQKFSAVYRQLVGALEAYARRKNGRFTLRFGFSDATNFRRAFRTWSGASPAAFQKLHRHRSEILT